MVEKRVSLVSGSVSVPEKDYSREASSYDQTRYHSSKGNFTSDRETALLRNAVMKFVLERRRMVDVACGTGNFTVSLANLFDAAVGVDLTMEMLRKAVQKRDADSDPKILWVQASLNALPLRAMQSDLLITTRFLHLFPRALHRNIIETLMQHLRPGGVLIVEHDGLICEWASWIVGGLKGKRKEGWSSYHPAEEPEAGLRRIARIGVSAPGLPTLSLFSYRVATWLSRLFVHPPLNLLSTFLIVVYRKT